MHTHSYNRSSMLGDTDTDMYLSTKSESSSLIGNKGDTHGNSPIVRKRPFDSNEPR